MSWRTIVISKSAKLDYQMGYMVIRQNEVQKVHLSEVSLLLVESTAVSITCALMAKLLERKITVIFCDEKRNPMAELLSYYGSHDSSAKIRDQIHWNARIKSEIWTELVEAKLRLQAEVLNYYDKMEDAEKIHAYIHELKPGDPANREAHGAKVYFHGLFGKGFSRSVDTSLNACLNYGYTVLLSCINREIVSSGYLTQIGIRHDNTFNPFNLSSDFIEPLRPLVDREVKELNPRKFESAEKMRLLSLLDQEVELYGRKHLLKHAITIYVKSVLDAIQKEDKSLIRFIHCL